MRNLIHYITRYPIWSNAIILMIVALGLVGMFSIKKSFFPEIDPNLVIIQVVYPGASPEEMEEGVVIKVEEALKGLEGLEQVTSTATENRAYITVEINPDYDAELVLMDIKNAVDKINSFPESAEKPLVYNSKPKGSAIKIILASSLDLNTLKKYAEGIKDDLLASGIISQMTISGYPEREISIEISEATLIRYGLTFEEIANAIRFNNRDISSGTIKTSQEEILIRSRNKKTNVDALGEIIIRTNTDGSLLRLRDLAQVESQFADVPSKSSYNGKNAVTIQVQTLPEEDVIQVVDYVRTYSAEFNENQEQVEIILSNDQSDYLKQRLNVLFENGFFGLLLVLVSLGLFLNPRLAVWVAFGIPFSFLGMLFCAYLLDVSINIISLFGMILVVGILVDDGIIVGENIYSQYEKGKRPLQACVDGTLEVLPSVFTGVTTTIIAFSAFFFIEGRIGQIIFEMAIVVILCLAFSLFECIVVLPPHIAHSGALDRKQKNKVQQVVDKFMFFVRDRVYAWVLAKVVQHRYLTLATAIAITMICIGLMQGRHIKQSFFPFIDSDTIEASLTMKPGTRSSITEERLKAIEEKVWELNEQLSAEREDGKAVVESVEWQVGSAGGGQGSSSSQQSGTHLGLVRMQLLAGEERNIETFKISARLNALVGEIPGAEQFTVGGRTFFGKPISISLKSKSQEELEAAKSKIKAALRDRSELKDVTDSNLPGNREIDIKLKPQAYALGLTTDDITKQIRQGFFGEEVQRLQIGTDEVKVWLRYPEAERSSLSEMESIRIRTANGEYPLGELISYQMDRGVISIQHLDGARETRIEADMKDKTQSADLILEDIKSNLVPELQRQYPGLTVSFEGQQRTSNQFSSSLVTAGPIILLAIFLIIALAFRSFSQAFLILLMIPLGIVGAILGHYFVGKQFSLFSVYGIIALTGVIVNDAVVFADKYNRLLQQGHSLSKAIFYAAKSRFRPILLTSLTTVLGLYPLILAKSRQAQFLIPMAVSIAYGVLIGTFFILTVFPALIMVTNDIRVGLKGLWLLFWNWKLRLPERIDVEPAIQEEKKVEKIS
ncbi:MAG: efflux RND transporter permease subunit [Bacteroidota bacterium]